MTAELPLKSRKILVMATHGFEQSELEIPVATLENAGADVQVASVTSGDICGWDGDDWGDEFEVDLTIADAEVDNYDALILPGGQINPDLLRSDPDAIALIGAFAKSGKPVAAICHAPWLLIEAGLANGRLMTGFPSIRTDLVNAGARLVDEPVVVDDNLITSRNPDDLPAFCDAIIAALVEVRVPA
jgi:protease I